MMKKAGLFYGSSLGNTKSVADSIAKELGIDKSDIFDVSNVKAEQLLDYEVLFFGSSTWGVGDLQDDWESFIRKMGKTDLSGKKLLFLEPAIHLHIPILFATLSALLLKQPSMQAPF